MTFHGLKYFRYFLSSILLVCALVYSPLLSAKKCKPFANSLLEGSELESQSDLVRYAQQGKLPDTQEHLRTFFKIAEKKYMKKFANDDDIKSFKKLLKTIVEKGKVSKDALSDLKSDRILALRVRSNYIMFSASHKPPKDFHKFVREFGNLNDALAEKDPATAKVIAEKLLKFIKKDYHQPKTFGFDPAPNGSITDFSRKTLERIEFDLGRDLDIHEYHDIRKELRNFRIIYETVNKEAPSKIYKDLAKQAAEISDEMGKVKDDLFLDKNHQNARVKIEPQIQDAIKKFIAHFKAINPK